MCNFRPSTIPTRSTRPWSRLTEAFSTPKTQVDWWAGELNDEGRRVGQASRHGYIIISPVWSGPHQTSYEYSRAEHLAVLFSLRDACQRFSVDTDRVFLSGHSMGGGRRVGYWPGSP